LPRESKFSFIEFIRKFSLLIFCKNNSPKEELVYTGFGIFCVISTICTMYYMSGIPAWREKKSLLYIYESMLIFSVFFITHPIWPISLKKEIIIQVAWNIGVLYLLIVCSSFFLMLSNFGSMEVLVFTMNLIIVAILTRWKIAVGMIVVGLYLGNQFYKYYTGVSFESTNLKVESSSFILYALLLIGTAIVIFLKPKQEKQELTEAKIDHLGERISDREKALEKALAAKEEFIRNITHEFHAPQTGIKSMAEVLFESYHTLTDQQRLSAAETIFKSSVRLSSYYDSLIDLARISATDYELTLAQVDLSNLLHERIELCQKLYIEDDARTFIIDIKERLIGMYDKYHISQTFDNLIINAINYCKSGCISISLKRINTEVEFTIIDEGIGIPKEELYDIFKPFAVSSRTKTSAGGRGVGLALCEKVIKLHNGTIEAESDGKKGAIFKFNLPLLCTT
jgi:signal transduction histidine kinase